MIRCICCNVTQDVIEHLVEEHGLTEREAMSRLQAGTVCGKCIELEDETDDHKKPE